MDVQVGIPPPPPPPPPLPGFLSAPVSSDGTSIPPPPPPPPPPPSSSSAPAPTPVAAPTTATTATQERVWLHPWTPAEMREYASQWSLAGDAGLLRSLEQFSDRLVQRADTIQEHLNQTVIAVKSTHTRVQNCLNEFLTLANTQFIENRVYDEDETINATENKSDEKPNEKNNANNVEAQEKVLQRYVEAIQCALTILDSHFERIDPKLDDGNPSMINEEDEEDNGIVLDPILEPKDPYFYRPLPLLIGTTEFMQDPYVGLQDLLNIEEEDGYDVEHASKPVEEHLTDESSDYDDEQEDDAKDFTAEVTVPPLVPAGASRPDFSKPTQITLTDDEDNDDDPFGIGTTKPKFTDFTFDTTTTQPKPAETPAKPTNPSKNDFDTDSNDEGDDSPLFGNAPRKATVPPSVPKTKMFDDESSNDDDNGGGKAEEPKESEDEEPEAKKPAGVSIFGAGAGMSALEAAVAARRRKVEGLPEPEKNDDQEEKPKRKPTKVLGDPLSASTSSSTTNTTQKLPAPSSSSGNKPSKPSIFGVPAKSDDDSDDGSQIFNSTTVVKTPIVPPTTNTPKPPVKKEKDLFDEDSDEGDIFSAAQKTIPVKKVEPVAPLNISKTIPKPVIVESSDEDSDDFMKTVTQNKSSNVPKPPVTKNKNDSDDDSPFDSPPASTKTTAPVTTNVPPQKPATTVAKDSDSDTEQFGITKKPPKGAIQVLPPIKPANQPKKVSDSEDDDPLSAIIKKPSEVKPIPPVSTPSAKKIESSDDDTPFSPAVNKPTQATKPAVTPAASSTKKALSSDDEDFPAPTVKKPVQPPMVAPPKQTIDSDDEDFLPKAVKKPVQPPVVAPVKQKIGSDSDDDELFKKPAVIKPAASSSTSKPAINPIAKVTTSEFVDPLSSIVVKPVETTPTPKATIGDSEDEDPPTTPRELNPGALKPGEKLSVKEMQKRMTIPVGGPKPGGMIRPKPAQTVEETTSPVAKAVSPIDDESDEDPLFPSKNKKPVVKPKKESPMTASVEPKKIDDSPIKSVPSTELTPDQNMLNIAKDRAKLARGNRAPRSRPTRRADISEGTDDLFGVATSVPTPAPAPAPIRSPSPPPAPIVKEPVAPVTTGLNAQTAPSLVVKEKKKFSLFDSDDSDLDDLLFGSKSKKTAKPAATTTKTTKPSGKSVLSTLDDDDDDFLSRRPVKKSTKSTNKDSIFDDDGDGAKKGSGTNKAKKDWSILDSKKDDKSSTNSKSKATRNKGTDDVDDIFA